jgi:putative PIG3 family NAD(P)H quinone oxidoreductase
MQQIGLPDDMAAVEISAPGPPDVLRVVRRPVPKPANDEVLIKVAAAGVNRPDCLQRLGLYPPPPGASDLPGLEVAGTVIKAGDDVRSLRAGDNVCALLSGGGYAEFCTAPEVQCLPVPTGFSFTQAAALPETFFTVWSNVFERGQLTAGESILIHGGASGIGTTAIQMSHAFGTRVFATVGDEEKRVLCEKLGAERAINYRREKFLDVVKDATGGRGVNVILDIVGGNYLEDNVKLLTTDGRLIIIGLLGGSKAQINLGLILTRRLTVTGSTLRARSPAKKGKIAESLLENVWPKLESGEIAPVIQASFPLAEAAKAHVLIEANQSMGKLVLRVGE